MSPLFRARTPKNRYLIEPEHLPSLAWLALSFVLTIVSLAAPGFGQTLKGGTLALIAPLMGAVQAPVKAVSGGAASVVEISDIKTEVATLRADNHRLMSWYHEARRLQAENERLRATANRVDDPKATFVTARVVMDQDQAYLRTALIAAGSRNGVTAGQAVLEGDSLIGRVLETSDQVARLLLVTDASSRIPVMIEQTGLRAILAGTNDDEPELVYVPDDADIKDGARVVTSGHGGIFPPYMPVGVVRRDEDKRYRVILFADLSALDLVRVVNYSLSIDLPVKRREKTTPATKTDLDGNKPKEEKETPAAVPAPAEEEGEE